MTAAIARETWERSVERYNLAPYCEQVKERGDEVIFLSKYITAVRLSDESTYLVHPLYLTQFDTHKIIIELNEGALNDYEKQLLFRDSNQLALINDDLMRIFNDGKYVVKDAEKTARIERLVTVAKENFYEKMKANFQTRASPLPLPHPTDPAKVRQYIAKPIM